MQGLLGCDREQLRDWLREQGFPAYRADQILGWVYEQGVCAWSGMKNLGGALQAALSAELGELCQGRLEREQRSNDGAVKLLLRWPDGAATETVLMAEGKRRTVCISSQVGCPVGGGGNGGTGVVGTQAFG